MLFYESQYFFSPIEYTSEEEAIKATTVPHTPAETLASKRVVAPAETIIVPFNQYSHPTVYASLKECQTKIINSITDNNESESNDQPKPFKRQHTMHGTIISLVLPASTEAYHQKVSQLDMVGVVKQIKKMLKSRLTFTIGQCSLNADGNVIARFTLDQLFEYKMKLKECGAELRYTDPDKNKTIAVVLATVDLQQLSSKMVEEIQQALNTLQITLQGKSFTLNTIHIVDHLKRTIAPSTIWSREVFASEESGLPNRLNLS